MVPFSGHTAKKQTRAHITALRCTLDMQQQVITSAHWIACAYLKFFMRLFSCAHLKFFKLVVQLKKTNAPFDQLMHPHGSIHHVGLTHATDASHATNRQSGVSAPVDSGW